MRFWFGWRGGPLPVATLLEPQWLPVWVQTVPPDSSPMPPLLEWWLLSRSPNVSLTTAGDGYPNRCQAWPWSRLSRWLRVESGFPLVEVWVWDTPIVWDLHRLTLHQLGFYAVVKHHDKGSCCQERFALGLQLPRDKSYHYDCRWRRTRVWVIGTTMTSHLKLQVGNRVNWSWWETFNSKVLPQWCTSSKTAPPKPSQTIQPTEYHIFKH